MKNFFTTIQNQETIVEQLLDRVKVSDATPILEPMEKLPENFNQLKRSLLPLRGAQFSLKNIQNEDDFIRISKATMTFFKRTHQESFELIQQSEQDLKELKRVSNPFYLM